MRDCRGCRLRGLTVIIQTKRRKHLTKAILTGIPEVSRDGDPGKLLTEGIYDTIRHPRYVELVMFVLAYSFLANVLASYAAAFLTVPTLYLVVLLEERELAERFGSAYEEYCDKVPRLFMLTWQFSSCCRHTKMLPTHGVSATERRAAANDDRPVSG